MIPLTRAGLFCIVSAALAVGFALGWGGALLRGSSEGAALAMHSQRGGPVRQGGSEALSTKVPALSESGGAQQANFDPAGDSSSIVSFDAALQEALKRSDSTDRLIRITEILRSLPVEQFPDAFAQVKRLSYFDRQQVLAALGSRWAELDLQGALAFGLRNGRTGPHGANSFLNGVVSKWASESPAEATAWANTIPPGEDRNIALNAIIFGVGRSDPSAVVQLIQDQGITWQPGMAIEELFSNWAIRDPQSAITAATDLRGSAGYMAFRGVARSWTQENPQAALAWGEKIPKAEMRKFVLQIVIEQWAESDPLSVIAWSQNVQDPDIKREALTKGISQLAAINFPDAIVQIERLELAEREQVVSMVANSLCKKDVRAAIQLLGELEPSPRRNDAISRMCRIWADMEPRAAVEWMFENNLPSNISYEVSSMLGRWAEQAPDEAVAWAQTLPPGEKRETALGGLAVTLSFLEGERAQTLFNQLSPDTKASIAGTYARGLANNNVEKARAWAETLPPGKAQREAFGTIAFQLADKDVAEASQWLEKLPIGPGKDGAVQGFSNYISKRDPDAALAWALTISDESDRLRHVGDLYQEWLATDSVNARKWLNSNEQISPEQKKYLQER